MGSVEIATAVGCAVLIASQLSRTNIHRNRLEFTGWAFIALAFFEFKGCVG